MFSIQFSSEEKEELSSGTSVSAYKSMWSYKPGNQNVNNHLRKNLNTYMTRMVMIITINVSSTYHWL
jgi:hypothetical protein